MRKKHMSFIPPPVTHEEKENIFLKNIQTNKPKYLLQSAI